MLPNFSNLCPKCTQWLKRNVTADSGIDDQLINHSWIKRVLNS